jgi:hypothetical protein
MLRAGNSGDFYCELFGEFESRDWLSRKKHFVREIPHISIVNFSVNQSARALEKSSKWNEGFEDYFGRGGLTGFPEFAEWRGVPGRCCCQVASESGQPRESDLRGS